MAISQSFFVRTAAGAPDTDVYTVFFSVLIAWLFLESFGTKYEQKKKKIILAILAGLSTGLFAFAWGGWWYIFDFILGTIFIYLLYLLIKYKKKIFEEVRTKNAILTAVSYLASTLFFVSIIINIQSFIDAVSGPISVFFLKEAAKESLWPNVYNTVAELGETNFSAVMDTLGGKLLFLINPFTESYPVSGYHFDHGCKWTFGRYVNESILGDLVEKLFINPKLQAN